MAEPFDLGNLGAAAPDATTTDVRGKNFFAALPDNAGVQEKSFASVQSMQDEGFTFTYRLARVSFPKIREYGLKWDERSRTMYATTQILSARESTYNREYTLSGIQFRNPNAINGKYFDNNDPRNISKRGSESIDEARTSDARIDRFIQRYKVAFGQTFPTGLNNNPQFILAKTDFRSETPYQLNGDVRGVETNIDRSWNNLMNALNTDGKLGAGGIDKQICEIEQGCAR